MGFNSAFRGLKVGSLAELQPESTRILANAILYCEVRFFFFEDERKRMKGKPPVETAADSYFPMLSAPVCLVASFVVIASFKALRHHERLAGVCFDRFCAQLL